MLTVNDGIALDGDCVIVCPSMSPTDRRVQSRHGLGETRESPIHEVVGVFEGLRLPFDGDDGDRF